MYFPLPIEWNDILIICNLNSNWSGGASKCKTVNSVGILLYSFVHITVNFAELAPVTVVVKML